MYMADIHMRVLVAIPLVADTKQRRNVSRETKKEKERQEKTAENEHDVRSIKIGLYIVVVVVVQIFQFDVCPQVEW